jgi:hypothetical protein
MSFSGNTWTPSAGTGERDHNVPVLLKGIAAVGQDEIGGASAVPLHRVEHTPMLVYFQAIANGPLSFVTLANEPHTKDHLKVYVRW